MFSDRMPHYPPHDPDEVEAGLVAPDGPTPHGDGHSVADSPNPLPADPEREATAVTYRVTMSSAM